MTCSITYPAANSDGAVDDDGQLVSCCGQWLRPVGSSPDVECVIYGKVYPATGTVDPNPDPDTFARATLLPSPTDDSGTFHFNGSPLPGATQGVAGRVKLWITTDDVHFEPFGPRSFVGCVYGAGDCDSPPCLEEVGVPADDNVIDQIAPVEYRVEPDQRTVNLFDVAKSHRAGKLAFESISLTYSLPDSSPSLAVWIAGGVKDPSALRLEVKRGSCGCLTSTLYLLRKTEHSVEPAVRWRSEHFNLIYGGVLEAISTKGKKVGGCLRVSVPPAKEKGRGEKAQKE
jgi:hypothetical protein